MLKPKTRRRLGGSLHEARALATASSLSFSICWISRSLSAFRSSRTHIPMARTYLVFGDIERKLDVLRVECARCQRKGRYSVRRLIEKYERNANMMKWKEQLNGDCPKRDAPQMHERCDLICPDLPKVL